MALHVVSYSLTRGSARKAQAALRVAFFRAIPVFLLFLLLDPLLHAQSPALAATAAVAKSIWRVQEFMVPMRDGVHLQTVVITRRGQTPPLPILLTRTPYGVPTQEEFDKTAAKNGTEWLPTNWKELAADGYIFVRQNLRGRFKSEGVFLMTEQYDPNDPKQANETNDAYDTIDWLVKNVPHNNGRVGIYGVSYDGLDCRADAAASAPGAEGNQRTGFSGGPVDERRYAPLRSAARELCLRVLGAGRSR
jgi:hypothetical protein